MASIHEGFHRLGTVLGCIVEGLGILLAVLLAYFGNYWWSINTVVIFGCAACISYAAVWTCGWVVAGFIDPDAARARTFQEALEEFSGSIIGLTTVALPVLIVGAAANGLGGFSDYLLDWAKAIPPGSKFEPLIYFLLALSNAMSLFTESTPWYWRVPATVVVLTILLFVSGFVIVMVGELLFGWRHLLSNLPFRRKTPEFRRPRHPADAP